MVSYRPRPDISFIYDTHGQTTIKDVTGLHKCDHAVMTRGFHNTIHRPTPFADRAPKMHLAFKLAGEPEMDTMKLALGDIPHSMHDIGKRRIFVDVEGAYNITRAIKALFKPEDADNSFLTEDMYNALDYTHEGFCMTERYYTPSS